MPGTFINIWPNRPGYWSQCTECGAQVKGVKGVMDHQCPQDQGNQEDATDRTTTSDDASANGGSAAP